MHKHVYALSCVSVLLAACIGGESNFLSSTSPLSDTPTSTITAASTQARNILRPMDTMSMQYFPEGTYALSTKPLNSFWIDQQAVTIGQYHQCALEGPCTLSLACTLGTHVLNSHSTVDSKITCVTWSDSKHYCEWVGKRLPTEVEWQVAGQHMDLGHDFWSQVYDGFRCAVSENQANQDWPTNGWITASPESQGMDSKILEYGIPDFLQLSDQPHSLLVVRHGYLVMEEYFRGYSPTKVQDVASVCKSYLSTLIGIAIDKGFIHSVDQRIVDFFPEQIAHGMDPRINELTLWHLLTMSSGFDWWEMEPEKPGGDLDIWAKSGDSPWIVLGRRIKYEPGTVWNYCSPCVHMLSVIIERAVGEKPRTFAQQYLMDPLGIPAEAWYWATTGQGFNTGGWALNVTPRDMAKLGYLFLREGIWDGKQIISKGWVRDALRPQVKLDDWSTYRYGYLWWVNSLGGTPTYYAVGHGGQYIFMIPTEDLVVVITQETSQHDTSEPLLYIRQWILGAITGP